MLAKLRLSPVSYVLLGAVEAAGSCTPYDLKRLVAERVGPLYEIAHSQYYDETGRLAKLGLLEERPAGDGRRRVFYSITPEGRRELLRWLRVPDYSRPELRDSGLLKLAFTDALDGDEVAQLARDQLEVLVALRDELGASGDGAERAADARAADPSARTLSLLVADAMAAFWERIAEGPTRAPESV